MVDESKLIEKEKSSELIFDGRVLHLYRDEVILPDGSESVREYCNHNGGVCVLPLTDDGEVILVKQYRYAHRKCTLEIPAGKLEKGENADIHSAALRELKEETGAECDELTICPADTKRNWGRICFRSPGFFPGKSSRCL